MRALKKQKLRKLKGGNRIKDYYTEIRQQVKLSGRNVAQKNILIHARK